jgi:hypothetical protein
MAILHQESNAALLLTIDELRVYGEQQIRA